MTVATRDRPRISARNNPLMPESKNHSIPIEDCTAPVVVVGIDGKIEVVNDSFCSMFGYERMRIEGKPVALLVPEDARDGHSDQMKRWFAKPTNRLMGNLNSRVRILDCLGRARPVSIGLSRGEGGSAVSMIVPNLSESRTWEAAKVISAGLIGALMVGTGRMVEGLSELQLLGMMLVGMVVTRIGQDLGVSPVRK